MDLHLLLKRLIVADILLALFSIVLEIMFEGLLPPELQEFRNRQIEQPWRTADWAIAAIELSGAAFYVAGLYGLWKLKKRSRVYFALGLMLVLIARAGAEPYIFPPPVEVCFALSAVVGGLILGIGFFSDLSRQFNEDREENAATTQTH